jgi:replicative DNA helicase
MLTSDNPRVQPHDLEAEQAILGAILIDSTALAAAQEVMTPADLYDSRHRRIFEAMTQLDGAGTILDLVTVGDRLDQNGHLEGIGGRGAVAELITAVSCAAKVAHHARIVRDHGIRRRLIKMGVSVTQQAYEKAPVESLLHEAEGTLFELSSGRGECAWCSASEISKETVSYVDRLSKRGTGLGGIPTGFSTLDGLLGGWQRSELIIVGARPGMGKTSLALASALAAAEQGYRVGIISIEMARRQIGMRCHCMIASVDVLDLRTGRLTPDDWSRLAQAAQHFESLPLSVCEGGGLTVEQVAAKARQAKASSGLDFLVIDYLGLLRLGDGERHDLRIADATRKFKLLATELDIPVLLLCQLSRRCEDRDNKRPMLSDLRDSGSIEQDADVVLFIYREEFYNPDSDEKGTAEILVKKHRNGPIGDRKLRFVDQFARFEDSDSE